MPSSDERFARQHRGGPPPGFRPASPSPGIDHRLSGPHGAAPPRAAAQPPRTWGVSRSLRTGVPLVLAAPRGSSVRVSRRGRHADGRPGSGLLSGRRASFSPFARATWSAIGPGSYLALEGPRLPSRCTLKQRYSTRGPQDHRTGLAPSAAGHSRPLAAVCVRAPQRAFGAGSSRVARRWGESRLVSAPGRTDMLKFRPSSPAPRAAQAGRTAAGRASPGSTRQTACTEAPVPRRHAFEGRCFPGRAGPHRVSRAAALFVVARAEASAGAGGAGPTAARAAHARDPSAGSPTDTLLRLLLPPGAGARGLGRSPPRPVGRSDGRCVQGAGTQSARVRPRAYGTFLVRGGVPARGPGHGGRSGHPRRRGLCPPV